MSQISDSQITNVNIFKILCIVDSISVFVNMKIELGLHIVKRLKTLDEFADLGRDELKESVTELIEELLEEYANDNCTDDGNDNQDDYE